MGKSDLIVLKKALDEERFSEIDLGGMEDLSPPDHGARDFRTSQLRNHDIKTPPGRKRNIQEPEPDLVNDSGIISKGA